MCSYSSRDDIAAIVQLQHFSNWFINFPDGQMLNFDPNFTAIRSQVYN